MQFQSLRPRRFSRMLAVLSALFVLGQVTPAIAGPITFSGGITSGVNGHLLAASATFDMTSSTNVRLTLTNTSTQTYGGSNGFAVPSDLLTAVYFNVAPSALAANPLTSAVASQVVTGDTSTFHVTATNLNVLSPPYNGGWGFTLNAPPQGVGTAGLGNFQVGGGQQFPFGIINSQYVGNGNPAMQGALLTRDTIVFDFTVIDPFFLSNIGDVVFQYGTSTSEPSFTGQLLLPTVPVPGTLVLAASGLFSLGIGGGIRRRFRRDST